MAYRMYQNDSVGHLNEDPLAPGKDMTFWMNDMGWLGKLAGGLLTGVVGMMVAAIMAGKDKMAMKQLETYMNKMVEMVDNGVHKKKSLLGKIMGSLGFGDRDEYDGDQSKACFRTIQENYLKEIACNGMVLMKNMGFLSDNCSTAISEVETNRFGKAGLGRFQEFVMDPICKLSNKI